MGPGDIAGVQTKRRNFAFAEEEKAEAPPATSDPWYIYATQDVDVGGGRIAVKAYKWTRILDWTQAEVIRSIAAQKGIQIIKTQRPPKDVR
jgi:hypothetical protein